MYLHSILCGMPLVWGIALVGLVLAAMDFFIGCLAWQMLIEAESVGWLLEWKHLLHDGVAAFSVFFYLLAFWDFVVSFGDYTDNQRIVGTWVLLHSAVILFILIVGLMSSLTIVRMLAVGYSLVMLKSLFVNFTWKLV